MYPKLGEHIHVHLEDDMALPGRQIICFTSKNRQVRIQGQYAHKLFHFVLPLLNGLRSIDEIAEINSVRLSRDVIDEFIEALKQKYLLYDGKNLSSDNPQDNKYHTILSCFLEARIDTRVAFERMQASKIAIFGLNGAGSFAAWSLAAVGVGCMSLIDLGLVESTDVGAIPSFTPRDIGLLRQDVLGRQIAETYPEISLITYREDEQSPDFVSRVTSSSNLVLVCLETVQMEWIIQLEQACRESNVPWILCSVGSLEGIVGPIFRPPHTPCYSCYSVRTIGGIDGSDYKSSMTMTRERAYPASTQEALPFGHGIIGNLTAIQVLRLLVDDHEPLESGIIRVVDFYQQTNTKHTFLRQPWCSVCGSSPIS